MRGRYSAGVSGFAYLEHFRRPARPLVETAGTTVRRKDVQREQRVATAPRPILGVCQQRTSSTRAFGVCGGRDDRNVGVRRTKKVRGLEHVQATHGRAVSLRNQYLVPLRPRPHRVHHFPGVRNGNILGTPPGGQSKDVSRQANSTSTAFISDSCRADLKRIVRRAHDIISSHDDPDRRPQLDCD